MSQVEESTRKAFADHKLLVFVFMSVVASFVLVMMSFSLYVSSGASQLDLSRPGLAKIRSQAKNDNDFQSFPATGVLDQSSMDSFEKLYDSKLGDLTAIEAFKSDVLSPKSLQIK